MERNKFVVLWKIYFHGKVQDSYGIQGLKKWINTLKFEQLERPEVNKIDILSRLLQMVIRPLIYYSTYILLSPGPCIFHELEKKSRGVGSPPL